MLISARKASHLLARDGVSPCTALQVLAAGLAGEPIHTSAMDLYEHERVAELAARPSVWWPEADQLCRPGFFLSRRSFPATAQRADQVAALSGEWGSVSPWRWVVMHHRLTTHGSFPFVATVGGLVVLGADIVETRGCSELVLEEPGAWFRGWQGRWFPTGRGRPWVLILPAPVAPEKIAA
jgi:hypothetical protein